MIEVTYLNVCLGLGAAFVVGMITYDVFVTLILSDAFNQRFNARRSFPIRVIVYGLVVILYAVIWVFRLNWIPGLLLVIGVVATIIGFIIHSVAAGKKSVNSAP